jgi:hypothetical protein
MSIPNQFQVSTEFGIVAGDPNEFQIPPNFGIGV